MKKIIFTMAVLAVTSVNAQVVKIYQGEGSQPVTFRNPSSIHFCTDMEDETYNPDESSEDASLYLATPFLSSGNMLSYTTETNLAGNLSKLLIVAESRNATGLNGVVIEPNEFQEIKEFTEQNVVNGKNSKYDKMKAILAWCRSNIAYMNVVPEYDPDVDPNWAYQVFKNRTAVCQGYSNLCNVMLESQGIPAVNANGLLGGYGGHAWVYTLIDDTWYVIDPTNDGSSAYKATTTSSYASNLIPYQFDMPLFEDNTCVYGFRGKTFNVDQVKSSESAIFSVPYAVRGYKLQSFDPQAPLPANIREIYLHQFILTIGEYVEGLKRYGTNLVNIFVEDANTKLCDYDGCVYTAASKKPDQLLYIPGAKKEVHIAPMATVGKNTVSGNESIEKIWFDVTSKTFEGWAVEDCPNLKEIHIAADATYDTNSFTGVHKDCKVLKDVE